jgi:hypothetical protein
MMTPPTMSTTVPLADCMSRALSAEFWWPVDFPALRANPRVE